VTPQKGLTRTEKGALRWPRNRENWRRLRGKPETRGKGDKRERERGGAKIREPPDTRKENPEKTPEVLSSAWKVLYAEVVCRKRPVTGAAGREDSKIGGKLWERRMVGRNAHLLSD